jgi:hypothetical protein
MNKKDALLVIDPKLLNTYDDDTLSSNNSHNSNPISREIEREIEQL